MRIFLLLAIDKIFCVQEQRIVTNDFTISYKGKIFQLIKNQPAIIRPKNRVIVCQYLDRKISIRVRNFELNFKEIGLHKITKLSPVDYVLQQRGDSPGSRVYDAPFEGKLEGVITNTKTEVENRNFSCW